jgi:hypothetical protein
MKSAVLPSFVALFRIVNLLDKQEQSVHVPCS